MGYMLGNSTYFISAPIWPEESHPFVLLYSCPWPGDSCRLHVKVGNGMQLHGRDFGMWSPCVSTASAGAIWDCHLSFTSKSVSPFFFLTERKTSERKTRQGAWGLEVPNTAHSFLQMGFFIFFQWERAFPNAKPKRNFAHFWLNKFLRTSAAFTFSQR